MEFKRHTVAAAFSSGPVMLQAEWEAGQDTEVEFGPASGPCIEPPEIEYEVFWQYLTLTFPFPVHVVDTEYDRETRVATLYLEAGDEDYADVTYRFEPLGEGGELVVEKATGTTIEVQVHTSGRDLRHIGGRYERICLR